MDMIGRIRRLHGRKNKSEREIARITGLSRNTVAKWLHGEVDGPPKYRRGEQPNKLTAFHDALKQALKADARRPKHERRTAQALYAEIKSAGYDGGYTPRHRLHPGVAPGRRPGGVGQRLRAAGLRARRGVPVRLERGRPGGRRHLLPRAGLAHEAVRQPGVLAGGLPEPGPRDAVRCPHPLVRGAGRRGPARHLRQHEDGGRQGQEGQGPHRQRALRHHVRALPVRPRLLQRGQRLGEGRRREERAGQPPAHLDRRGQGQVRQLHRTQRLAGRSMPRLVGGGPPPRARSVQRGRDAGARAART